MNAIIPVNVAALRVDKNDSTNIVSQFKGRTANFNNMPYTRDDRRASTGDEVVRPLQSDDSPLNPLGVGIHLHWELPDHFKRGVQKPDSPQTKFPQTPNRWLVIRYLSIYDEKKKVWGTVTTKSWIIESDYISKDLIPDSDGVRRPMVPVPLPSRPAPGEQPYRYMGRVLDAEKWDPSTENKNDYLPAFNGSDGKPCYLTSIGFLGPGFSSYYPDCCSVYGFWDRFEDNETIYKAIQENLPVQFKSSYQVIGWIADGGEEPLSGLGNDIKKQYDNYVSQCREENTAVDQTPADFFTSLAMQKYKWSFQPDDIQYTLNNDETIKSLTVPQKTLCSGVIQEVVWNALTSPSTTYFLNNPENKSNPAIWTDTVDLAVGAAPVEALSALIKVEMQNQNDSEDVLKNYELMLDALQLGLLHELAGKSNKLIEMDEALHSAGFSRNQGGLSWTVQQNGQGQEVSLPLDLAEKLSVLNTAQKAYDMGRDRVDVMRKQLYMDWFRYVKMYAGGQSDGHVSVNTLVTFLTGSGGSEVKSVIDTGDTVGILEFVQNDLSGSIIGVKQPSGNRNDSLAMKVYNAFADIKNALSSHPDLSTLATPATPFRLPLEPVTVMEGDRIEPARRNGSATYLMVRVSQRLIDRLDVNYQSDDFHVDADKISAIPSLNPAIPEKDDVLSLVREAFYFIPTLASFVADALKAAGGAVNPAVTGEAEFILSYNEARGGLSPLEGGTDSGLYGRMHQSQYSASENPESDSKTPMAITFTFTNATSTGWVPNPVAWNAQQHYPEFDVHRYDPFLPVSLIWDVRVDPLVRTQKENYSDTVILDLFQLNEDHVDYVYKMDHEKAVPFTTGTYTPYTSSVFLSKKPTYSLTRQIENYISNYPSDTVDTDLQKIEAYENRNIMSQTMSGLNVNQNLKNYIAQITVEDLTMGPRDAVTTAVAGATTANPGDNWYDDGFNSQSPISQGLPALNNFGPLRSGFLSIMGLEIVDVFGQRMQLTTKKLNSDGSLNVITSISMKPRPDDKANAEKIYLPPRIMTPSRLWFRWLSATHSKKGGSDFVEMNFHPATSPVTGWVFPNHLDNSLFFYQIDGSPIGSFGIEHNDSVYRTRAGNTENPESSLEKDIGPEGSPTVNPHLASFLWYIHGKDAAFLRDLMGTIQRSESFNASASSSQNSSLSVLVGRPLALTRAIIGMESAGSVLPLSQADSQGDDPWPVAVNNNQYEYTERMKTGSAKLGDVEFPVRMGDLPNLDDGLVGFLIEKSGEPYDIFYSPAAPVDGAHGVKAPSVDTLTLKLNDSPRELTMLVDPDGAVHATMGVLPVEEISIPADQYADSMLNIQMTFFTMPVLEQAHNMEIPLPAQAGFTWSWVNPGDSVEIPLKANASNSNADWSYTPQTALEGWLKLSPESEDPS